MAQHALFSPSGFEAVMVCNGKIAMELGLPDKPSSYSDEGTAAHLLLEHCLINGAIPAAFRGREIVVGSHDASQWDGALWLDDSPIGFDVRNTFTVNAEMIDAIQRVLDNVHATVDGHVKAGATVQVMAETRVPIGHITGEEGAEGTSDVIIVATYPDRVVVEVHDLKYGKGVEVFPTENPQAILYGLGAIEHLGLALAHDTIDVVLVIQQPRIADAPRVWETTYAWMQTWVEEHARPTTERAWAAVKFREQWGETHVKYLKADADACRFCKAREDCPEFDRFTRDALQAEFTDLTTQDAEGQRELVDGLVERIPESGVGARMDAVEVVEMWCKAIRARAESMLLAGRPVAGYKLVNGKAPARAWNDEEKAEAEMKAMRLKRDEMYTLKLISPTQAEKLLKATPKRWARVSGFISRGEGKPSVARADDKRDALEIAPIEAEFAPIVYESGGQTVIEIPTEAAEDLV